MTLNCRIETAVESVVCLVCSCSLAACGLSLKSQRLLTWDTALEILVAIRTKNCSHVTKVFCTHGKGAADMLQTLGNWLSVVHCFCRSALFVIDLVFFINFSHSGEAWIQKLRSHLVRSQSLKVLPSKAWTRWKYSHLCFAYCQRFLPRYHFYLSGPGHSPSFFSKPLPSSSWVKIK